MKTTIICSFCCASAMAFAQEKDSINAPINLAQVSIYNQTEIKAEQSLNTSFQHQDVFNQHPEIKLIKRSNYAIDPSFRANQYEQLNVQFDGGIKAMNACPNRMDPITTHLSMNQIQEVEIIKGPYSMRFGPTFGGIVNLISHQFTDQLGWNGAFTSAYQSNPNAFTNHARLAYIGKKFDVQGGYNYQDFGDYKDGRGTSIPSSFRTQDYHIKLAYKTVDNSKYEIGLQQQFGRDIMHATLPMDTSFDDTTILHFIGTTKFNQKFLKEIQSKAYFSEVKHQMHNLNRPNTKMMRMITDVESITSGGKVEAIYQFKRFKLFTGLDAFYLFRDGTRNNTMLMQNGMHLPNPITTQSSVWQKTTQTNFGIFFQGEYRFNYKNKLDFGARLDRNELLIKDPSVTFIELYYSFNPIDINLSGTIGYTHIFNRYTELKFNAGRGVRSGDMIEQSINQHQVGMDGASYLGNPNLKPEINHQIDLGFKKTIPFISSWINTISVDASVYYSLIHNYIVAKAKNIEIEGKNLSLKQFENVNKAYKTGFDLAWSVLFNSHFSLKGNVNYIYTENKDWNEALALTPPLENKVRFGYHNKWLITDFEYQFVNHQNKIAYSFQEKPSNSYHLFNINSEFNITKGLNIVAGVENLLDTFYQSHLNFNYKNQANLPVMQRMTNPGRNFKLMVKYTF